MVNHRFRVLKHLRLGSEQKVQRLKGRVHLYRLLRFLFPVHLKAKYIELSFSGIDIQDNWSSTPAPMTPKTSNSNYETCCSLCDEPELHLRLQIQEQWRFPLNPLFFITSKKGGAIRYLVKVWPATWNRPSTTGNKFECVQLDGFWAILGWFWNTGLVKTFKPEMFCFFF